MSSSLRQLISQDISSTSTEGTNMAEQHAVVAGNAVPSTQSMHQILTDIIRQFIKQRKRSQKAEEEISKRNIHELRRRDGPASRETLQRKRLMKEAVRHQYGQQGKLEAAAAAQPQALESAVVVPQSKEALEAYSFELHPQHGAARRRYRDDSLSDTVRGYARRAIPTGPGISRPRPTQRLRNHPPSMSSGPNDNLQSMLGDTKASALPSILKNSIYSPGRGAVNGTGANTDGEPFVAIASSAYAEELPDTALDVYVVTDGSQGYPEPVNHIPRGKNESRMRSYNNWVHANREKCESEAATFWQVELRDNQTQVREAVDTLEAILGSRDGDTTDIQRPEMQSILAATIGVPGSELNPTGLRSYTNGTQTIANSINTIRDPESAQPLSVGA